jgi:hypothetical protein
VTVASNFEVLAEVENFDLLRVALVGVRADVVSELFSCVICGSRAHVLGDGHGYINADFRNTGTEAD